MKSVLLGLLDVMVANEALLRSGHNVVALHDFRVAMRKSRVVLGQIGGVFPKRVCSRFQGNLAWVGRVSGPLRDLDVQLLNFEAYRRDAPVSARPEMDRLWRVVRARRDQGRQVLLATLDSRRYRRFTHDWRVFLQTPAPGRPRLPNANKPIGEFACRRIAKLYQQVTAQGVVIEAGSPDTAFHELRRTCKKLRYIIDILDDIRFESGIRKVQKTLKKIQDRLGAVQDSHVQTGLLESLDRDMAPQGGTVVGSNRAIQHLVQDLRERQTREKAAFAKCFADLPTPDTFAALLVEE